MLHEHTFHRDGFLKKVTGTTPYDRVVAGTELYVVGDHLFIFVPDEEKAESDTTPVPREEVIRTIRGLISALDDVLPTVQGNQLADGRRVEYLARCYEAESLLSRIRSV